MMLLQQLKPGMYATIFVTTLSLMGSAADVTIEKTDFQGWPNSYKLSNGEVELVVVTDIGPRILHYGFVGGDNVLQVAENTAGSTGGNSWNGYGGHRFWIAPEVDMTYYPDNDPVRVTINGNTITLTSAPELIDPAMRDTYSVDEVWQQYENSIGFRRNLTVQKEMQITLEEDGTITIVHAAQNVGENLLEIAPWALTVMAKEGLAVIPNPPFAPHGPGNWLPVRSIITWSYTDLSDERLSFTPRFITLQQDPEASSPLKIGFSDTSGWSAYVLNDNLFIKTMDQMKDKTYPDMGSAVELFTNAGILEIESLGPLETLHPGQTMSHEERWNLHRIDAGQADDLDGLFDNIGK